jgi:hypothetical protein
MASQRQLDMWIACKHIFELMAGLEMAMNLCKDARPQGIGAADGASVDICDRVAWLQVAVQC